MSKRDTSTSHGGDGGGGVTEYDKNGKKTSSWEMQKAQPDDDEVNFDPAIRSRMRHEIPPLRGRPPTGIRACCGNLCKRPVTAAVIALTILVFLIGVWATDVHGAHRTDAVQEQVWDLQTQLVGVAMWRNETDAVITAMQSEVRNLTARINELNFTMSYHEVRNEYHASEVSEDLIRVAGILRATWDCLVDGVGSVACNEIIEIIEMTRESEIETQEGGHDHAATY